MANRAATKKMLAAGFERARQLPLVPSLIILALVVVALFAPLLAPHDPTVTSLSIRYTPPFQDWNHILGTDNLGRDELSRLVYGARVSLLVGLISVLVSATVGITAGIFSGYLGGWVDQVIMRITDTWLAFPPLILAIFLAIIIGPGVKNVIIVLALAMWTRYARVIRGEVLSLKQRDFIRLAVVAGVSPKKIMWKHILPNVLNTSMVLATLMFGTVIIAEAGLSFLGVGVPPPNPAWGSMLNDARATLSNGIWWLTVFPGIAIAAVVLAFQLFGDWLRVRLDPQLRDL